MADVELRLTRPMMHGPAVVRLQEFGDRLGFDYGPNDGVFGGDTQRVVIDLQGHLGLPQTGVCDQATWDTILAALDGCEPASAPAVPARLIDRSKDHPKPKLYAGPRAWTTVAGVTLHQTGCMMPRTATGWDRLNAHVGVTVDGLIVLVNPFTDFIWHAQGLSQATIGIEIAGNFAGVEGDARTVWRGGGGPHSLTVAQTEALHVALAWIDGELRRRGARLAGLHAHRQSSKTRVADPGSKVWQEVAVPWLRRRGGSDGGAAWKTGTGNPIPKQWNPQYPSDYFARAA